MDKIKYTAVFVAISRQRQRDEQVLEYLDELKFLAETAGIEGGKYFIQKMDKPNPKTFIGSGKVEEISKYIEENPTDYVIFDEELSPSQMRNLEKLLSAIDDLDDVTNVYTNAE